MTSVHQDKVTTFDHHSPEYAQDSLAINAELRAQCPVAHSPAYGGFWVFSKYDDVVQAAKDDETFASGYAVNGVTPLGVTIPPSPMPHYPIEMDPPDYWPLRKLLNPLFSPAMSKAWQPRITRWVDVCIDQVIETGTFDVVDDLANAVPALFTCEFLGLPLGNWREYAEVMHELIFTPPQEQGPIIERYISMMGGLYALITKRRANPGNDAISTLVTAEVDGKPIADEIVLNMIDLIMAGGFDTTTAVVANALIWLADNPVERQLLIDDPTLIPRACEEFLRHFTPQQGLARTVTKPVTIGDVELQAGERAFFSWASANHDEAVFECPNEVRIDRFPNRHTTFGIGIHRCLGSHIARAELTTMVARVLARMPDLRVDHDAARRYPSIGIVNGWVSVPATFTPGTRMYGDALPAPMT